jgi:hypothetical protein
MSFCEAKTHRPKIRREADFRRAKAALGAAFAPAQGIEAEFPAPGGGGELERIARFFAAEPQKMRPKHLQYKESVARGITAASLE